jgi:transglutaminase-like putative cysteine protease
MLILDPITRSLVQPQRITSPAAEPAPRKLTLNTSPRVGPAAPAYARIPAPGHISKAGDGDSYRLPLGPGEDAPQILAYLHDLAEQFAKEPYVREFTVNEVLGPAGVSDNDQEAQILTILNFVRRNVTYVRDPLDSEYIVSPINLIDKIRNGKRAFSDCEDHVLLLNTMLGSVGFPTRFVATQINGADWWNHVISSVYVDGAWWDLDPIAKGIPQPDYPVRLEGQTNFAQ